MQPGWNLISFNVEPPVASVASVLQSINERYDRVLGELGIYSPSLPEQYNTLTELHTSFGYYVRIQDATSVNLLVEGLEQPCSAPKELHAGWNWIGAPCTLTETAIALQSIEGHYQRILSIDKTYDPSLPEFSTLDNLTPGEGYLIYMTESASLVYPDENREISEGSDITRSTCGNVMPTPYSTIIYGQIMINEGLAPRGALVQVITPQGDVAGCGYTLAGGLLPLTQVYGTDEDGKIIGFSEDEILTLRINGVDSEIVLDVFWEDDKQPHWVEGSVQIDSLNFFVPIFIR